MKHKDHAIDHLIDRAAETKQVLAALDRYLDFYPQELTTKIPGKSKWFGHGFSCADPEEFVIVVVKNGNGVRLHRIRDYFDRLDRPEIYKRLRPFLKPNAPQNTIDFLYNLSWLFILREVVSGLVTVEPWSRAMHKAGESPARHYTPVKVKVEGRAGLFDNDMDKYLRGKELKATIDALVKHFPADKRELFRTTFWHIADGGNGAAPQTRAGKKLDPKEVRRVVEGWFAVKGEVLRTQYLKSKSMPMTTFKRYKHRYRQLWPDEWKKLVGATTAR